MTQVASNAHRVEIVSALTALGSQAAGMSAGQWAQMSPTPAGLNLFTEVGGLFGGGASGLSIAYTSKFARDATNKKLYFTGSDHFGIPNPANAHGLTLTYSEAANAWTLLGYTPWGVSPGGSSTPNHGYEGLCFDTTRSQLWFKPPYAGVIKRHNGSNAWTDFSLNPPAGYTGAIGAAVYFPEIDRFVYWAMENLPNGILVGVNPATGATSTLVASGSSLSGAGDYSEFIHHSAVRHLVYFGGGVGASGGGHSVWTYTQAGVLTRRDNLPSAIDQAGPGGSGSKHMFVNPLNGNLVGMASASSWYELNIDASPGSQWSAKSGTASILSANTVDGSAYGVTVCEYPEYGVVVFMKNYSGSQPAQMWLWKGN